MRTLPEDGLSSRLPAHCASLASNAVKSSLLAQGGPIQRATHAVGIVLA